MTDIPASMKPWHGGEGPPHDWNREQAMRRDGQLEMARDIMQAQWWGSNDDWDIIAYIPKPPAGGDAGAVGLDRATLMHCARVIRDRAVTVSSASLGGGYVSEASKIAARHLITAVEDMDKEAAALALPAPVVEGWQPIETAPYSTEVIVRAGEMTFRAELVRDGAMTTMEDPCDQWAATREGEHPPCWSGGLCWEVNEDENTSLQPDAWMHVLATLSEGRSHG